MEGLAKVRKGNVLKRRGLLAGVTALSAALAAKMSTPGRVEAADGGNMIIGATNNATLTTNLISTGSTAIYVQAGSNRAIWAVNPGGGTTVLAQGTASASGVQGEASTNAGIVGSSGTNAGVYGQGRYGCWGQGLGGNSVGVYGAISAGAAGAVAGLFDGPVVANGAVTINGDFGATGMKSSIVKNRRGVDVRLFAVEAPDSVFEDFGMGTTGSDGSVVVNIPGDFRDVVKTEQYLVFLSAYGRNGGLYIEEQNEGGFKVRDSAGTGGVTFSWRLVAKRSDIEIQRFAPISSEDRGANVDRIRQPELAPSPSGGGQRSR